MLSRIADSLFWMARYMERTNGILRMLRINVITSLDRDTEFSPTSILQLYAALDAPTAAAIGENPDAVLLHMLGNKENPNAVRNLVAKARENARGAQDHLTKETWECLNAFYHAVNNPDLEKAIKKGEQIMMLTRLSEHCLLFHGVTDVTMPRGQGWHYMNAGKMIERATQTIDTLDIRFQRLDYDLERSTDVTHWRNLLLSLSGYELYLKRYRGGLPSRNVVDLALLNRDFPRSVLYCVQHLERIIKELAFNNPETSAQLLKSIGRLHAKVEYSDLETIAQQGLQPYLRETKQDFYALSNLLGQTYFAYQ